MGDDDVVCRQPPDNAVTNSDCETVRRWQGYTVKQIGGVEKKLSLAHDVCTVPGTFNDGNYWKTSACLSSSIFHPCCLEQIKMTAANSKECKRT